MKRWEKLQVWGSSWTKQLILNAPVKVGTDNQYFQNKTQAQIP
jgi:hypothetical protein